MADDLDSVTLQNNVINAELKDNTNDLLIPKQANDSEHLSALFGDVQSYINTILTLPKSPMVGSVPICAYDVDGQSPISTAPYMQNYLRDICRYRFMLQAKMWLQNRPDEFKVIHKKILTEMHAKCDEYLKSPVIAPRKLTVDESIMFYNKYGFIEFIDHADRSQHQKIVEQIKASIFASSEYKADSNRYTWRVISWNGTYDISKLIERNDLIESDIIGVNKKKIERFITVHIPPKKELTRKPVVQLTDGSCIAIYNKTLEKKIMDMKSNFPCIKHKLVSPNNIISQVATYLPYDDIAAKSHNISHLYQLILTHIRRILTLSVISANASVRNKREIIYANYKTISKLITLYWKPIRNLAKTLPTYIAFPITDSSHIAEISAKIRNAISDASKQIEVSRYGYSIEHSICQ